MVVLQRVNWNSLGSGYYDQGHGQYNEPKEYHEKALIIKNKIFGKKHRDVAKKNDSEAKEYHE